MQFIGFNAMKVREKCKHILLCRKSLNTAKTTFSLRLNAFFSKNDVEFAKTRCFALKGRFINIIAFKAMIVRANMMTFAKLG